MIRGLFLTDSTIFTQVGKVLCGISQLQQTEKSLDHQLAIVTSIRKTTSTEAFTQEDAEDLLLNTSLLKTLHQILAFESATEQCYYMKLEALWTLSDLACFDSLNTMRLLSSSLDSRDLDESKSSLEQDLKCCNSAILHATDQILAQIVKSECRDMKTTKMIFDFLTNLVAEGGTLIP